jgi:16S rRNA G966 N2-methylase RsmD
MLKNFFVLIFLTIVKLYRWVWYLFRIYILEKPRGLDFYRTVYNNNNVHEYSIIPVSQLKKIFDWLNGSKLMSIGGGIIDIGCGKGLALVTAASYSYGKVIGIDLISELIRIAKRNINILKLQDRIQVFTADAVVFEHYDEYDTFYLYNPFEEDIFSRVVNRIINTLETHPRKITIIYANPKCHSVVMETCRFEMIKEFRFKFKEIKVYIYRNK